MIVRSAVDTLISSNGCLPSPRGNIVVGTEAMQDSMSTSSKSNLIRRGGKIVETGGQIL